MTVTEQLHQHLAEAIADGKTIRGIARDTGINHSILHHFYHDPDRQITADTINALADYFGICAEKTS